MHKYAGYILSAIILTLSILGARLQENAFLYAMLGVVILSVVLVLFDRVDRQQYPVLIFFMCLGLIYQTTLLSNFLIGTDVLYEYQFAVRTFNNGYWDYTLGHSYNSAASISVFLPFLARFLHLPLEWVFKIVPPLFLAGIPTVTYFIFKKEFNTKTAFIAAFFFISIPTVLVELPGIAKQSIGELFLVLCLCLIISNAIKKKLIRYPLIGLFALLTMLSHYSMGGVLWGYLLGSVVLLLVAKYLVKLKPTVHIGLLCLAIVVSVSIGVTYYGWADRGAALADIKACVSFQVNRVIEDDPIIVTLPDAFPDAFPDAPPTAPRLPEGATPGRPSDAPIPLFGSGGGVELVSWLTQDDPMLAFATGGDFFISPLLGKLFRILQYMTQLLLIIGVIVILRNFRKYSPEYLAMCFLGVVMMALVVFYPGVSTLLNATRFYNLALLFMAPAIVVGGRLLFRNYKALVIGVLIPYFLFTSGAVFEMSKSTDISTIYIPYTHALSAIRVDTAAVFTDNDIIVRDWVKANNKFPVYGDIGGANAMLAVQSNLGLEVNTLLKSWVVSWLVYRDGKLESLPDDCYIILRERNVETETLTFQVGVGLRRIMSYADADFHKVLEDRTIVFRSGNALVYGAKESADNAKN